MNFGDPALARWVDDVIAAHAVYVTHDWRTLGYATWSAYLDSEFGQYRVKLPKALRREIVATMTSARMSSRAIGAALGVDHKTVVNDRHARWSRREQIMP